MLGLPPLGRVASGVPAVTWILVIKQSSHIQGYPWAIMSGWRLNDSRLEPLMLMMRAFCGKPRPLLMLLMSGPHRTAAADAHDARSLRVVRGYPIFMQKRTRKWVVSAALPSGLVVLR